MHPMYKLGFNCANFLQFRDLAAVVELLKPKILKSYIHILLHDYLADDR